MSVDRNGWRLALVGTAAWTESGALGARRGGLKQPTPNIAGDEKTGWKTDARLSALYARYVLALEVEGAVDKASGALKKALALQDMDEKSAKFGEFEM